MAKLRVHAFTMSLDGYGAGPDQGPDAPLGAGGMALHDWVRRTRRFGEDLGTGGPATVGLDDAVLVQADAGIGATIMGRNMFGPVRGPWDDDDPWTGWWGENPPFHHPVYVLTNHPRDPLSMAGGTTFHFITDGIHRALELATEAADGLDVRLGGGVATIRAYLRAGLVDELHLAIAPLLLGRGEPLLAGLTDVAAGYECVELTSSPSVAHALLVPRRGDAPQEGG